MTKLLSACMAVFMLFSTAALSAQQDKPPKTEDSVVKIFTTHRLPNLLRPWLKQRPTESSASGVVIEGERILTNAHAVSYGSQIFVQPSNSSRKISAEVIAISEGMDLAVLKLDEKEFFKTRPPLKIPEELPELQQSVSVYGYPRTGRTMSITKGVVSGIDFVGYGGGHVGLRLQIDAALNPGNSGGPALVGDRMVGVAFLMAENVGYVIPNEEIVTFLKDTADGSYQGKPQLGSTLQSLENPALRAKLGLGEDVLGVLVRDTQVTDPDYPLKRGDVITRIGDYDLDNLGMVRLKGNLRLPFGYIIPKSLQEGAFPMSVLRGGETKHIKVPATPRKKSLIPSLNGTYPSYLVYGPLVFSPATSEFVGALAPYMATQWSLRRSPLLTRRSVEPAFDGEQLVIVTAMLPHKITVGYGNPTGQVVKDLNGVKIRNLRHLSELLRDAKDNFLTFEFAERYAETIVFDRAEMQAVTEDILTDNGIRKQYSDDLREVWEKQ